MGERLEHFGEYFNDNFQKVTLRPRDGAGDELIITKHGGVVNVQYKPWDHDDSMTTLIAGGEPLSDIAKIVRESNIGSSFTTHDLKEIEAQLLTPLRELRDYQFTINTMGSVDQEHNGIAYGIRKDIHGPNFSTIVVEMPVDITYRKSLDGNLGSDEDLETLAALKNRVIAKLKGNIEYRSLIEQAVQDTIGEIGFSDIIPMIEKEIKRK